MGLTHSLTHSLIASFCRATLLCLFLALTLGLAHCKSDDNGGGGGGGDPEPEPIDPAIYLWITGCTVLGDMSGDGMDGSCDNMTRGVAGADDICESRYAEDVASEHRTTIMEQHETGTLGHKALLASSGGDSNLPQNFDINGKDSQPIRRPDGTQIAPSWAAFFNGAQDLDDSISGTEDSYWTGLQWDTDAGTFALSPLTGEATTTCDDWSSNVRSVPSGTPGADPIANYGAFGSGDEIGATRISSVGVFFCNSTRLSSASVDTYLLCITH